MSEILTQKEKFEIVAQELETLGSLINSGID
jgi:hypothetical protein